MAKKKLTKFFSVGSKVLFYFFLVSGLLVTVLEAITIFNPKGKVAEGLGGFEPIYGTFNLTFDKEPALYDEQSFQLLSLADTVVLFAFVTLLFLLLHKLLKNVHEEQVFMYENVSLLFKLGLLVLVIGSVSTLLGEILSARALEQLTVTNADLSYTPFAFADFIITGIVLIVISVTLKKAVHAVKENEETI
ncbi:DUF2975 domain-containing protein [Thalassobacillus hwangdonensis]|uniref:DUF2975 domain-containing protein n=1 Tax=Thalassobacillus hwangdonensis TaxID=546108 RepID=A0ABW3KZ60_9BACI